MRIDLAALAWRRPSSVEERTSAGCALASSTPSASVLPRVFLGALLLHSSALAISKACAQRSPSAFFLARALSDFLPRLLLAVFRILLRLV